MKVLIDHDRGEVYMDEHKYTIYFRPMTIITSSEDSAIEIARERMAGWARTATDEEDGIDCIESDW